MKTGRIARLLDDKGFGFINSEGIDYFFHTSGCKTDFKTLRIKDKVSFSVEDSKKGPRAKDVELVS